MLGLEFAAAAVSASRGTHSLPPPTGPIEGEYSMSQAWHRRAAVSTRVLRVSVFDRKMKNAHGTDAGKRLDGYIIHANLKCGSSGTFVWNSTIQAKYPRIDRRDALRYSRLDEWSVFPREAAVRNIPICDESISICIAAEE